MEHIKVRRLGRGEAARQPEPEGCGLVEKVHCLACREAGCIDLVRRACR